MSGGSWEYFYSRLDNVADQLIGQEDPLRILLGHRLKLCAEALHDIEWVDSCDYSKGDDHASIKVALEAFGEYNFSDIAERFERAAKCLRRGSGQ